MTQFKSLVGLLVVATVVLATIAVSPVAAHDSQEIDGYEFTFGGADEPVITGERMWLVLSITDGDGEPVSDQADALEWRLEKPGEVDPIDLEVSEKHGEPGVYETPVVFTEPGEYVVHMEGTVEGTEVHTHFEKDVEDSATLEYPESTNDDANEDAFAFSLGPDFGVGVALGAIGAIVAFFIGRRFERPAPASA